MAFSSEVAACRFPGDSSTTAGLLSGPFALPPLRGGSEDTDLHHVPVNPRGRLPWLVFVSKGETKGLAFRLGLKRGKMHGFGKEPLHS